MRFLMQAMAFGLLASLPTAWSAAVAQGEPAPPAVTISLPKSLGRQTPQQFVVEAPKLPTPKQMPVTVTLPPALQEFNRESQREEPAATAAAETVPTQRLPRPGDASQTLPSEVAVAGRLQSGKDVVVISSCIHVDNSKPLGYTSLKRSMMPDSERFNQTLGTIQSVRQHMPNAQVILFEQSPVTMAEEKQLTAAVDALLKFDKDPTAKMLTSSPHKGRAEAYGMAWTLKWLEQQKLQHQWLFKLSGRYALDKDFDYKLLTSNPNKFHFKVDWNLPTRPSPYHITRLYSVPHNLETKLMQQLVRYESLADWGATGTKKEISIENEVMNGIDQNSVAYVRTLGVAGQSAVWGQERRDLEIVEHSAVDSRIQQLGAEVDALLQ